MTCAHGLLRLLWGGGPKLECYGTVYHHTPGINLFPTKDTSVTSDFLDTIAESSLSTFDSTSVRKLLFPTQISATSHQWSFFVLWQNDETVEAHSNPTSH